MDNDKKEQGTLSRLERKIIRRLYGPVKEDDKWTLRNNQETDVYKRQQSLFVTFLHRLTPHLLLSLRYK